MPELPDIAGNNIFRLRREKGLSQRELAERIGGNTHFTTVAKIERSQRKLTLDWIMKFAAALEVSPSEIAEGASAMPAARMVPLIGRIAAGAWKEAIQDPSGWVPTTEAGPNNFALVPDGDSMDRIVPPGATIIVDPDQIELSDGKIYAVMNAAGETTFKRFRTSPLRLEPCSTNPEHQPILVGKEPFTVVGRVVAQTSLL